MSYCQVSDVVGVGPGIGEITGTTKPNAGQVTNMIAEVERSLDAQLENLGYDTPVVQADSPIAFAIIKDKVAHAVIARVLRARAFGATDPKTLGATDAQKVFDEWLKALGNEDDPTELPDAVKTDDAILKDASSRTRSHVTDLSDEELGDTESSPTVSTRQVF